MLHCSGACEYHVGRTEACVFEQSFTLPVFDQTFYIKKCPSVIMQEKGLICCIDFDFIIKSAC